MKILYVANDRRAAQLVVNALRVHAPDATLASTESLLDAERWVSANRDLTALVVDAEVQNQSSASFVRHVRGLGLAAPIVVVASEATGTPSAVLKAGADDFVTAGDSLSTDLPDVVDRTLKRRAAAQPSGQTLRILYAGDAALARQSLAHPAWSIGIAEAVLTPDEPFQPIPADFPETGEPLPFDILFVEHDHPEVDAFSVLKHIADRGLQVPVIVVVEWDDALGLPALKLGAVDCVVKSAETFRALTYRLDRLFAAQAQDDRAQRELAAARQSWEETRTKLETSAAAEAAAAAEQRARRETDQAEASAARRAVERRLAEVEAALQEATAGASTELAAARKQSAQLKADLEDRLAQEVAARKTAEHNLAHADALFRETELRRAAEASSSANLLGRRAAELTASLAHATRSRDTIILQLSDAESALEESRKERARQDAELAEAAAARQALERRLTEAEANLQQATRRAAAEHDAGAQAALAGSAAGGRSAFGGCGGRARGR